MNIVVQASPVALWHSLICDAEAAATYHLDEELQSYVVFLLMRFADNPDISNKILALEYIKSLNCHGRRHHDRLRDVGDTCLLYAGLFPGRAKRKRVSSHYFTDLGRGAYQVLSDNPAHVQHQVYQRLSETFVHITHILQAICKLETPAAAELEQSSSQLITSVNSITTH